MSYDHGYSVIQQVDGKLVVAGHTEGGFALARYEEAGTLDASFGGVDGVVTTMIGIDFSFGPSIVQQADGKLVVAGTAAIGSTFDYHFVLARYNPDGSLDPSFGGDGIVTAPIGIYDFSPTVIQTTDGKLVVVGGHQSDFAGEFAIARYNSDGSLDPMFGGGDGVVLTTVGSSWGIGKDVIELPDGRLVMLGTNGRSEGSDYFVDLALVRYNPDGTLDGSFGDGGMPDATVSEQSAFAITIPANLFTDPDGEVIAYSAAQADGNPLPAWMTFDPGTSVLSGTPPLGAVDFDLRITTTDPQGGSASDVFRLTTTPVNGSFVAGPGTETFSGGAGSDTFVFRNGFSADTITDFTPGEDLIDLSAVTDPDWTTFAEVQAAATQVGADALIDFGGGNSITLVGVTATALTAADFQL